MRSAIEKVIHEKNTLGGVLEIVALNVPPGLGSFAQWDRRLEARSPVDGLFLCGAATHPGGSVIALNGRIAAEQALAAVPA